MTLACIDVHYAGTSATAACVLAPDWQADAPALEVTAALANVAAYQPGEFYRRELPCLLEVLGRLPQLPDVVIVDGYVWLSDESRPGLGAHLYESLQRKAAVVGVAKTRFADARLAHAVLRGGSARPLYVTAAGLDGAVAAAHVAGMHGAHRVPTLLRRVDQLCRGRAA